MQPLYFLPDEQLFDVLTDGIIKRDVLAKHGIADSFSDVQGPKAGDCDAADCVSGPEGLKGVILAYKRPDGKGPAPHYQERGWDWAKCRGNLWIGTQGEVTADDLQRPRGYDGYKIPLADMGDWLIPVIRRDDGSTELPRVMGWDDAGTFTETIREKYRDFWETTRDVLVWLTEPNGTDNMDKGHAARLAVRALTINYRFGMVEQRALQVVDSENFLTILGMTIDLVKITEVALAQSEDAKKKDSLNQGPPITSSTPGPPEDSPATVPAVATST